MRQIRQTLRLHLEAGLTYAQVARALGTGKSTVGKIVLLARAADVDWAVAQTLSDGGDKRDKMGVLLPCFCLVLGIAD